MGLRQPYSRICISENLCIHCPASGACWNFDFTAVMNIFEAVRVHTWTWHSFQCHIGLGCQHPSLCRRAVSRSTMPCSWLPQFLSSPSIFPLLKVLCRVRVYWRVQLNYVLWEYPPSESNCLCMQTFSSLVSTLTTSMLFFLHSACALSKFCYILHWLSKLVLKISLNPYFVSRNNINGVVCGFYLLC